MRRCGTSHVTVHGRRRPPARWCAGRGRPWALHCTSTAPSTGPSTHATPVTAMCVAQQVVVAADHDRGGRHVDVDHVALRPAAGQAEARALADRDQLDRVDLADRARRRCRRTRPRRNGMRSPRNAARPPSEVMKHTSWLSGLAAVRRPSAAASRRTSALSMSPTGNSVRAERGLVEHVHHVALVLGAVGAALERERHRRPCGRRGRGGRWRRRRSRAASAAAQQPVELEVAVALDARVRRDARRRGRRRRAPRRARRSRRRS